MSVRIPDGRNPLVRRSIADPRRDAAMEMEGGAVLPVGHPARPIPAPMRVVSTGRKRLPAVPVPSWLWNLMRGRLARHAGSRGRARWSPGRISDRTCGRGPGVPEARNHGPRRRAGIQPLSRVPPAATAQVRMHPYPVVPQPENIVIGPRKMWWCRHSRPEIPPEVVGAGHPTISL